VWALAPYMSSYSSIGSSAADATAMADAFTLASYYANTSTGTVPGLNVPAGMTVPVAQIDTLADILASCMDTAGGVVGDGSTCGTLFATAMPVGETAPVNVIDAGRNIANNPTANISGLFALVAPTAPYQPTLEAMPASLTLGLSPMSGLSLSSGALAFPSATVGVASTPLSVTVTNTGAAAITLNGASFLARQRATSAWRLAARIRWLLGRPVRCRLCSRLLLRGRGVRLSRFQATRRTLSLRFL
jgi:hypothetical protein